MKTRRVIELGRASVFIIVLTLAFSGLHGIAEAGVNEETVAFVNGDKIHGLEIREALGLWGGAISASDIPEEKKKEALDRLIAGRLLEQSARSKDLDNTDVFRERMTQGEPGLLIPALFRAEAASRVKITGEEIKAEAGRLRKADKKLAAEEARLRAKQAVLESKFRKANEDLIVTARKEAGVTLNDETLGKIAGSDNVLDNAVLGTAGPESVTYGDVKKILQRMGGEKRAGSDFSGNSAMVRGMLDRELTRIALTVYAKKMRIEESEWMGRLHRELERSVLIDILAEKVILKGVTVTDKEIRDTYAKHSQMLVRNGKTIPLSEVKEEIRRVVQSEKRNKAMKDYVEKRKKKAKIKINEKLLQKI